MAVRLCEINSKKIEEISIDFHICHQCARHNLIGQLVQVLVFCSFSSPSCEQGAGWLFEFHLCY